MCWADRGQLPTGKDRLPCNSISDKYLNETVNDWAKEEHVNSDNLLRQVYSQNIKLIIDVDRKARVIMVVNSILLTLGLTIITKLMDHIHYALISAVISYITFVLIRSQHS